MVIGMDTCMRMLGVGECESENGGWGRTKGEMCFLAWPDVSGRMKWGLYVGVGMWMGGEQCFEVESRSRG